MGSGRIRQAYGLAKYGEMEYSEQSSFSLISPPRASHTSVVFPMRAEIGISCADWLRSLLVSLRHPSTCCSTN